MSKFHGVVGFATQVETVPGVWTDVVVKKVYHGDILQNIRRYESADKVNDDLTITNRISIVSDEYMYDHLSELKFVNWLNVNWKVSTIEVNRPRLVLNLGGVYNGET